MTHKTRTLHVAGLLAVAAALFLASCGGSGDEEATEIAVSVSVEEIRPGSIETFIEATGTAAAIGEAQLLSEKAGNYRLLKNPVTGRAWAPGDRVEAGAALVRLENPEEENSIAIDARKLAFENAERELEKQRSLYEKGGVTLTELNQAEENWLNAKYAYGNARINLAKLTVTSPIAGVLTSLPYRTPGVRVDAGTEIASVMDFRRLVLDVALPGKDLDRVKRGLDVRVTSYAVSGDTLAGTVERVGPAIDPATRTFATSIVVENPDLRFRPGMFVRAEVVTARRDSTIVIPKNIILSQREGKVVYIVEKGAARRRRLTTGLENPTHVEVVDGLAENERVVVKGFETLRNGAKVKIVR
ncbi:MAG: efflux RND transporter periplasmic adaptor subunit [Candidatus Krumholzibacteriota bacterium]|nr:efflux RND transporter periplasmic adaptor subunit [Candidatus Krumholzibacteriota bacterium]